MEGTEEEKYICPNFFPVLHVFNLTSMAVVNFAYTVKWILTNLFTVMPIFSIFFEYSLHPAHIQTKMNAPTI